MANLKASKKNIRKIERQTQENRQVRSRLKTLAKKISQLKEQGSASDAQRVAIEYVSALDKAAKRNIVHANKANRHKKALSKLVFSSAA